MFHHLEKKPVLQHTIQGHVCSKSFFQRKDSLIYRIPTSFKTIKLGSRIIPKSDSDVYELAKKFSDSRDTDKTKKWRIALIFFNHLLRTRKHNSTHERELLEKQIKRVRYKISIHANINELQKRMYANSQKKAQLDFEITEQQKIITQTRDSLREYKPDKIQNLRYGLSREEIRFESSSLRILKIQHRYTRQFTLNKFGPKKNELEAALKQKFKESEQVDREYRHLRVFRKVIGLWKTNVSHGWVAAKEEYREAMLKKKFRRS